MLPIIYVSKKVQKDLYQLINRSRVSPEFGSPKKLKTPSKAIEFLLKIALRYEFEDLERLARIPLIQGEMKPETFDNEEIRDKIIMKEIDENVQSRA